MSAVAVAENDVRSVSHGTFCHQDKLPRLPIPTLEHTCDLFLEMVQPIVGKKDYDDAVEAVQNFVIQHAGVVSEVEVNPLLVGRDFAVAADALIQGDFS